MLDSIEVENYRSFAKYRMSGLKRVNLLTGKNNSGKTSLLEAVQMVVGRTQKNILDKFARRRGELAILFDNSDPPEEINKFEQKLELKPLSSDATHFFHGHEFNNSSYFAIEGIVKSEFIRLRVSYLERSPEKEFRDISPTGYLMLVKTSQNEECKSYVGVGRNGELDSIIQSYGSSDIGSFSILIDSGSLSLDMLSVLWRFAVSERRETEVAKAMNVIDPNLEDLVIISIPSDRMSVQTSILISYKGLKHRVPLGSSGDGMRRMLALALALVTSTSGYLLIDEIDSGLHYSVMADMWRLVIETAERNNVQVFATTHSLDCLRGLKAACEHSPHLADQISVQTIDRGVDFAIENSGEELQIALDQCIEVR